MAISKLSIIKFLEMALAVTCIGLHYKSIEGDQQVSLLASGTFVGYFIILVALFAGYVMNTPINKRLDLFFSIVGSALFIASGALIIKYWDNAVWKTDTQKMAMTKGSLSIINGIVFFVDIVLTFRN